MATSSPRNNVLRAPFAQPFSQSPTDGRTAFADIASLLTVRGRRAENQDRAFAALIHGGDGPSAFVACVLDGMGGMPKGGEAAGLAAGAFLEAMSQSSDQSLAQRLETAIAAANSAVWEWLRGEGGTTLTAVAIDERPQVLCVHVGDSRIYARDQSIAQVTTDDTLAGLLGGDDSDFFGNGLMQFVGIGEGMLHQSFDLSAPLPATLLLSSDGLHSLSWLTLTEMFDPSEAGFDRIAKGGGLDDNATAVIIDVAKAVNAASHAKHGIRVTSTSGAATVQPTTTKSREKPSGV